MINREVLSLFIGMFLFATMPSSTNYDLHNYGFGSGGGTTSSTNYSLNGISGETSNVQSSSATYNSRSGNNNVQQASLPVAPTFNNPASYYDELHFAVIPGSSPSDTKFAIAISSDNFTTTNYINTDDTIGNTLSISQYQTYASWGGSSGQLVTDLTPNTTYQIKVSALQGNFTNSQFGPSASATTSTPSITFSIYTDSQSSPPFSTSFGNLLPATVTAASDKIWASISTNANSGVYIYVKSANAGLYSSHANTTIASASADLSSATTGYGAQGVGTTQSSGGPLSINAPYNVSSNSVGILDNNTRVIFSSSLPITSATGDFKLMAKAANTTVASSDYTDT